MNRIEELIPLIKDTALSAMCWSVVKNPVFLECPASLGFHHAYEGGLRDHTEEVVSAAYSMSESVPHPVDLDILLTSAVWHDCAKIHEYAKTEASDAWGHTGYGKTIHHVSGSAIEFSKVASQLGVNPDTISRIQHCILAHHGRREWGSPVEPATIEALILHQADMLSAKFPFPIPRNG